jgi:hypothetical protein
MTRGKAALLVGVGLLGASVFAHHGSSVSYDLTQRVTMQGAITEFKYINPHPALFWDVKNADGTVAHWTGEIAPNIAQLQQNGWGRKRSEAALAAGTAVTITLSPSRAGGSVGLIQKIVNAQGDAVLGEISLGPQASPPTGAEK